MSNTIKAGNGDFDLESDPYNDTPHTMGAKRDAGKLSYNKIPPEALRNLAKLYNEPNIDADLLFVHAFEPLIELARLLTRGAITYLPNSWKTISDIMNRCYDSGQRHREQHREVKIGDDLYDLDKVVDGKGIKGTGCLHLTASLWAEFVRLYTLIQELKKNGMPTHQYEDRFQLPYEPKTKVTNNKGGNYM